jgi:hypothetical protein
MITELNIVDPAIIPGNKIDVVEFNIRNLRMHKIVQALSRCLLFALECDSNNTSSKARPRDVRAIRAQFDIASSEIDFAEAHNDFPQASHEFAFKIYLIDQKEIQRIRNVKLNNVVSEIYNTCHVMLSLDSANTQGFIAEEDLLDIKEMMGLCNDAMDRWIGRGKDPADTGLVCPAFEILGELRPDVDGDFCSMGEGSSGTPLPKLPDVPDVDKNTPSTVKK